MEARLTAADLRQFTGSEEFHRHALVRNVRISEGAWYVAEKGGAHWLLDKIATNQMEPKIRAEEFQVWKLRLADGHGAMLACEDGDYNVVHREEIAFTDFPLAEIDLYFCNDTIHLPSEY